MGNILIEGAIDGLRLVGINVPPSAENFIEMLVNEGVDVVSEVPKIISFVEQLGAEAWSTIEQVATGMERYGPVGYIEHLIDQHYDPHYQTIKGINQQKKVMLDAHRTTLANFQTQVQTLSSGPQPFTGQAAISSSSKLTTLSTAMSGHLDLLENSLAIDQQFFAKYQSAKTDATDAAIIELIIIGILLLVAIIAVVATGGAALAVVGLGAVAAGGLSATAIGVLGGVAIIDAVFLEWALQHEGLVKPITLDWHWNPSGTTTYAPLVNSGKTLPNPNSKDIPLTPEEAKLINDLFNEFGGTIPKRVLQYLVRWLGASALTAAMIRCLYQNGYLNLPNTTYHSQSLERVYEKVWTNIYDHLDPNDLEGAWKDANPGEVDPTTITDPRYVSGADHAQEVDAALKSIDKFIKGLDGKLDDLNRRISYAPDPNAPNVLDMIGQKAHLQKLKDAFIKLQNFVQSKNAAGSPAPDTWPDKGQVPIIEDLLQVSTCKVPGAQYYK